MSSNHNRRPPVQHDHYHSDHDHDGHEHDHHQHGHGHDHSHGSGLFASIKHALVPHAHDHSEAIQSADMSSSQGIRAAWIGLAGMMATAVAQVVIVALSGSVALLADTIHNLGHAATTIPLIVAFRLGRRAATNRYSYGYRRAEDLVGLFIGLIILVSVVLIFFEAIDALINQREVTNLGWVFAAGIVGFMGNEVVAVYRIRAGRRINSAALIAEGHHARVDGLTSIAVVCGVVGVWLGFPEADAIMGFIIGVLVFGILVVSMRPVMRRLLDGVEDGLIERLTAVVATVPGVESVDRVRARWAGHRMECDITVRVASHLTVAEGHLVAEEVEHAVLHAAPNMDGAVVHLHPAVGDEELKELHELSDHHASREAREAYLARRA
ncbi:MAG: cation transporter [Acidimicrobiia bacterium]|nr:cation diffusion facilitator family transporter [bacterium]MXX63885.1 cation transporter [Acidimicrobiia bacterium]